MLTDSKRALREKYLSVYRKYKIINLVSKFFLLDLPLDNGLFTALFSRKEDINKELSMKHLTLLRYIDFLLLRNKFIDDNRLIEYTQSIMNEFPKHSFPKSRTELFEAIKNDKAVADEYFIDENHISSFKNDINNLYLNILRVFDYGNQAYFDKQLEALFNKKRSLVILDYFFESFINIDFFVWNFFSLYFTALYYYKNNETEKSAVQRIDKNIEKIHIKLCELLEIQKKVPSLLAINKLPSLLRLANLTPKELKSVIAGYAKIKPSKIMENVMQKIKKFDEQNKEFKFHVLYEFHYKRILDEKYFKLFKLLVPLSLLSTRGRREFNEYMRDEFDIQPFNINYTRELDDSE